ncbi:Lrp/AsnC family transcriptional regulator [Hydrogenibacillus sp. N12]|uniref:Lrp/AsnC family transcriptional regulator n=1 Tax=Hydrogenibacillus sp. N12 TaxID=2866627 RepID=UPI00207BE6C0|nr:Lrp/AsnC family transcriptional regulator [Hydrogenibacillus sp. N12]
MLLTECRKEFLRHLIELYHKTQLPVHDETLAKAIGVSKWTAYDMVKELEKLGYLIRDYVLTPGTAGRSQVVFIPSLKAIRLFEQGRKRKGLGERVARGQGQNPRDAESGQKPGLREIVQPFLHELVHAGSRAAFGARFFGLLLAYLRQLDRKTEALIQNLLSHVPAGRTRLALFIGTVFGLVAQAEGRDLDLTMAELIGRYVQSMVELTEQEVRLLDDFLREACL